ncbi:MAG: flavin prenyltransferase UbiX [Pirellulaceae bacterium]|nr:MAG: flavin prenyltransferase UbiX [Pirellulaceae bacterium]
MNEERRLPMVLAITGASGAVYAARLLETLILAGVKVHLVVSESGRAVIRHELRVDLQEDASDWQEMIRAGRRLLQLPAEPEQAPRPPADLVHSHRCDDYFTPIASGSYLTRGMVICPCSGATLAGIAHAASANLVQRAAEVHLKERRKLILVPRETPVSTLQLENQLRLSQAGAVLLPAAPGWYHGVRDLRDLVDFIVARVMDQLNIDHHQIRRWGSEETEEDA